MTKKLYEKYKQGFKIFTNYWVAFPHEKLNAERLVNMGKDLQNCAIGIDEMHVLIDSRNSQAKRNKMISYFILQTRKRNVHLFGTTQHEKQIEIRLRQNVDYWCECKRWHRKSKYFLYRVINGLTGQLVRHFRMNGERWFDYYDTTETITDFMPEG